MQETMYNKNHCDSCGYEWYPKGHSKSMSCPECGCREVLEEVEYEVKDLKLERRGWMVALFTIFVLSIAPFIEEENRWKVHMFSAGCGYAAWVMIRNKKDIIEYE